MQQLRPSATRWMAILVVLALALVTLAPGVLARGRIAQSDGFTVTHGPVIITLTDAGSDGHQLGDLRVTSLPVADENGTSIGRLDATLTTVGIDVPDPGDEVRISVLIFSFGDGADQIVVNGTAFYPRAGGTIAASSVVERPITGGSGRYAGATGWAATEHLDDDAWRHTFHIAGRPSRGIPQEPHVTRPRTPVDRSNASPPPAPAAGIVRTLLGEVEPTSAGGQTLSLWHYVIPAGQALVPHTHPGFQVARIVSGSLTYNVIEGEVSILRADGSAETITSGGVTTLQAGDTVIENPDVSHYGANDGNVPVVLYSSSLLATGVPPAEPLSSQDP